MPKIRADILSQRNLSNEITNNIPVPNNQTKNNWLRSPVISCSRIGTFKKKALIIMSPIRSILNITRKNMISSVKNFAEDPESEKSSVENINIGWTMKVRTEGYTTLNRAIRQKIVKTTK